MSNRVAIIIPVHNRIAFTRQCLKALEAQTCKDFSVIVVDDGSSDGTATMLRTQFPTVEVIQGDGNLFWTKATNLGVKSALERNPSWIMTLNDDTVPTPLFIETMLSWADRYPNALLGAFAFDFNTGKPAYAGERIDWRFLRTVSMLGKNDTLPGTPLVSVTHFPGRGLLIPAKVFSKIGLYDEKHFPQTAADDDFALHAARAGFPIYCNLDAKLGIFPAESGGDALRAHKTWSNYRAHLFSIKGGGNLKFFTYYVLRNSPWLYVPTNLFMGYLRRLIGYWIK